MKPKIRAAFAENYSVYGARKVWTALGRQSVVVGRDRVARLMRVMGLAGATRAKKRFTTRADPAAVRAPDLVHRNFTADRPDALWVADFTYVSTWSGVAYVAFITDVFSRRLVGWKASMNMRTSLVLDALEMASWARRNVPLTGLVCHSDAGSQYTSIAYTERLAELGADASIGTVGDSYDNALAETVNGSTKPSSSGTRSSWPPTVATGRASTTSRSPPAAGCPGSTNAASTKPSATSPRPSTRPPTTVTSVRPQRPENPTQRACARPRVLQGVLVLAVVGPARAPPWG
jgi:putative transposase